MQYKKIYVYILCNKPHGVLYIGQTNNLSRRMFEHKNGLIKGFTKRYNLKQLVYCEEYEDPREAFARERALKAWQRSWKIRLIESSNPDWNDLSLLMH